MIKTGGIMTCNNNDAKKGVAMAPVSVGTTAPAGKRDYTHTYCGDILTAVRALTKYAVAKPVPMNPSIKVIHGGVHHYRTLAEIKRMA